MLTSRDIEEVTRVLLEAIEKGFVVVEIDPEGVPRYRLTKLGRKYMDGVIAGNKE